MALGFRKLNVDVFFVSYSAFDHDPLPYIGKTSFLFSYTHFRLIFFRVASISFRNPDSLVLLSFGLWATVAGLHIAQILRSQHLIALKILLVHVKLMFFTSNRFFRFGPLPGHAPAWEITISATCR